MAMQTKTKTKKANAGFMAPPKKEKAPAPRAAPGPVSPRKSDYIVNQGRAKVDTVSMYGRKFITTIT